MGNSCPQILHLLSVPASIACAFIPLRRHIHCLRISMLYRQKLILCEMARCHVCISIQNRIWVKMWKYRYMTQSFNFYPFNHWTDPRINQSPSQRVNESTNPRISKSTNFTRIGFQSPLLAQAYLANDKMMTYKKINTAYTNRHSFDFLRGGLVLWTKRK